MKKNSIVFIVLSFTLLIVYTIVYKVVIYMYTGSLEISSWSPYAVMIAALLMSLVILSIRYAFPKRFKVVRIILLCLGPFLIFCGIMNWVSTT